VIGELIKKVTLIVTYTERTILLKYLKI